MCFSNIKACLHQIKIFKIASYDPFNYKMLYLSYLVHKKDF